MIQPSRRSFIAGLACLIVAPAIVRATNLMPVKVMEPLFGSQNERLWLVQWGETTISGVFPKGTGGLVVWDSNKNLHLDGHEPPMIIDQMNNALLRQPRLDRSFEFVANGAALHKFDKELEQLSPWPVVNLGRDGWLSRSFRGILIRIKQ